MTSATAMMPRSFLSISKNNGVFPSLANVIAFSSTLSLKLISVFINLALPAFAILPFIFPVRPLPGKILKSVAGSHSSPIRLGVAHTVSFAPTFSVIPTFPSST